jgi:hypothetical protein
MALGGTFGAGAFLSCDKACGARSESTLPTTSTTTPVALRVIALVVEPGEPGA